VEYNNPTLGHIFGKKFYPKGKSPSIFNAPLFTKAKTWNQTQYPSTYEWFR
jgi:hypothetical protein